MKMPEKKPNESENGYYTAFDDSSYFSEGVETENGLVNNGAQQDDDFSEYMWMEHMEEFDREVMKRLEEEALMEECIEAMLEDERTNPNVSQTANNAATNAARMLDPEATARTSKLNPLAAEFVPSNPRPDSVECSSAKPN